MHAPQDPRTAPLVALPEKLEAQHLLSLLPSLGYQAVMGADVGASAPDIQMPLYFTHAQIVVLPPSTDNPNNSRSKLNGIEANLDRAIADDHAPLLDKDLIFFPVFEEWQASMSLSWEPRQHWVLLVYLKAAQTVYLLDAMGPNRSEANYGPKKLAHMDVAVRKALAKLQFAVDHPLEKMYFDRQSISDTVSGGHWVSYWLHRFNQNIDLAALKSEMTTKQLQDVKADLTRVRQAAMLDVKEEIAGDSDHNPIVTVEIGSFNVEDLERQNYAQTEVLDAQNKQDNSNVRSILLSPSTVTHTKVIVPPHLSAQPLANTRPWYRFNLDFYSMLIYAGAVIALFAMFCLASATPLLSATVSAGALGVGVVVFLGGVLGKCGFFSSQSPLPYKEFSLAQDNYSLQV